MQAGFLHDKKQNMKLLYIDLFSGAGGTTTGVEMAKIDDEKWTLVWISPLGENQNRNES